MDKDQIDILKERINDTINQWARQQPTVTFNTLAANNPEPVAVPAEKPERTDGKRAVRTKSTGDRVYLIDDNAKTKQWITSPEVLSKLGFEMADVQDVEDSSLLGYQMQASIYKVD